MVWHWDPSFAQPGNPGNPGQAFEAGINYYLRDGASGLVQVEIADRYYRVVRTLQGPAAKGLNHVRWTARRAAALGQLNATPAGVPRGPAAAATLPLLAAAPPPPPRPFRGL